MKYVTQSKKTYYLSFINYKNRAEQLDKHCKKVMKNITTGNEQITLNAKYFIIQGNNGNHTGYNRQWAINCEGYKTKKEAEKVYREMVRDNGDIKYGLTSLCIVNADELVKIYESQERISFHNCFDISVNEIENEE